MASHEQDASPPSRSRHNYQWMDSLTAPLNPCSLETIPLPVALADGSSVWPLLLSCYQLQPDTGRRVGHLQLHTVQVPDIAGSNLASLPLSFGEPATLLSSDNVSGILDAKWFSMTPDEDEDEQLQWFFATAHATGEIRIHSFSVASPIGVDGQPRLESDPLYTVAMNIGQSSDASLLRPPQEEPAITAPPPLCLSLAWDTSTGDDASDSSSNPNLGGRLVSTYSNGRVAIHDVGFSWRPDLPHRHIQQAHVLERDSWYAHSLFTSPAEVWSACWAHTIDEHLVLSCGDEGCVKFWDVRSTTRPMQVLRGHFDAGVTSVSPHPHHPYLVACGSYDETLALYDVRYSKSNTIPLCRSAPLGGGIWRIKWHPVHENRMLVGAMHGGCKVLNVKHWGSVLEEQGDDEPLRPAFKVQNKFTEHASMVYGADWLVCKHPTQNGYFEAAASCSFYDRAVYLWDTVFRN